MLDRAQQALYGGGDGEAPPLRASCGETHGMAYWGRQSGWEVGNGRAVAVAEDARADRLVDGSRLVLTGTLRAARNDEGCAWSTHPAALRAFWGDGDGGSEIRGTLVVSSVTGGGIDVSLIDPPRFRR